MLWFNKGDEESIGCVHVGDNELISEPCVGCRLWINSHPPATLYFCQLHLDGKGRKHTHSRHTQHHDAMQTLKMTVFKIKPKQRSTTIGGTHMSDLKQRKKNSNTRQWKKDEGRGMDDKDACTCRDKLSPVQLPKTEGLTYKVSSLPHFQLS